MTNDAHDGPVPVDASHPPASAAGVQAPDLTPPPAPEAKNPATKFIVASVVPMVLSLFILGIIAVSAYNSESAGVTASLLGVPLIGALWAAFVGVGLMWATHQTDVPKTVGAGCGCGCLGFFGLLFMSWLFFFGIFPAL